MIRLLKKTAFLLLPFFLISCWGQEKDTDKPEEKGYKTMKAKDTPEVRERLKAFNAQEHRLEFTGCELRYNGKPFFIGDTLEEVEAVLGKHDYNRGIGYSWSPLNLEVFINKESGTITNIYIYMNHVFEEAMTANDDYRLINGIPLNRQMIFKDFLDSSNYTFDDLDFFTDDYSYKAQHCNHNNKELTVYFDSPVVYDYKGGGAYPVEGKVQT